MTVKSKEEIVSRINALHDIANQRPAERIALLMKIYALDEIVWALGYTDAKAEGAPPSETLAGHNQKPIAPSAAIPVPTEWKTNSKGDWAFSDKWPALTEAIRA